VWAEGPKGVIPCLYMPSPAKPHAKRSLAPYLVLLVFLTALSFGVRAAIGTYPSGPHAYDLAIFGFGAVLFTAYCINRVAPKTVVPSYVWAIFAGMALQPMIAPSITNASGLRAVMEVFAAIVLFAGGLEIPFRSFKRWFLPVASLSVFGLLLSAVAFAFGLIALLKFTGGYIPDLLPSIVILGAALASTDPTAIIPTLAHLRFTRPHLKEIAASESALTDVSGSVITRFLLLSIVSVPAAYGSGVLGYFAPLLKRATYDAFALQMVSGVLVGWFGFAAVNLFYRTKRKGAAPEADPALFLAVPIFTFAAGNALGGAGFLAAFVAGLLSDAGGGVSKVVHFYSSLLDHLIKPFIFVVLGALVPVPTLIALAPIGIAAALLFMFVVRPLAVSISLLPWIVKGVFTLRDILFLSFIRETGIIAAILLVIAASQRLIVSEFVMAVGVWVMVLTLVIEPPLTPYIAKKIGVAEEVK